MIDFNNDVVVDFEIRKIIDAKNISYGEAMRELISREQRLDFMASPQPTDETAQSVSDSNKIYDFVKTLNIRDKKKESETIKNLVMVFQRTGDSSHFKNLLSGLKKKPEMDFHSFTVDDKKEIMVFSKDGHINTY